MKKITYILLIAIALFAFNSCSKKVDGTKDINFVSFEHPSYSYNVMPDSTFKNGINVYTTQTSSSDRTIAVNVIDSLSTADPASYSVPASVTIPANSNHGVLTVSLVDKNVSANGNTLVIEFTPVAGLFRGAHTTLNIAEYCPLQNNPGDFAGTWSGTDAGYTTNNVVMVVDGDNLKVTGLSFGMIANWWGETITSGGTFSMTVSDNSTVSIPRQYIYTTDYNGDPYTYEIKGSGTWKNCSTSPTLQITYDIYYTGDAAGIGATYGSGAFVANLTLGTP